MKQNSNWKIIHDKYPFEKLIEATFLALKEKGNSASNTEIFNKIIEILNIDDNFLEIMHLDTQKSELEYQLAWARTYLKSFGIITNSSRGVWSITPEFAKFANINPQEIIEEFNKNKKIKENKQKDKVLEQKLEYVEENEEFQTWKNRLFKILTNMNPFAFEILAQRLLRECGFVDVEVTKKTGDGGIDGTGKFKLNGIFTFNVAFQCKRYSGSVSASAIRDFRGSLTTDIEKGLFITTGSFTRDAKEEAMKSGKKQIDLIDGEEFMEKLAQYGLGLKEIKDYEIDEKFFNNI
ncbi:restriction endonuclease [Campylobacter sp. JMF_08 NE1]|uniref:restriction endonuclease n=1 Tax=Campylobacter sp. JMF_08 NE1 TaxID=2983821 RepID=UPI0022E9B06E|nr:restriction endonuclease [Campylobacter sp. JMF_08 NE1]MDA3047660.1 restriction endonuclease [Campylobacter sp. JMF_08 NE1]